MRRWSAERLGFFLLLAAALSSPRLASACSGPGAAHIISRNEQLGWGLWAGSLVVALVFASVPAARAYGWRRQWPLMVLAVVHPGWWMSARSGECGYTLRDGSIFVTALTLVVGIVIYWRARRAFS